MPAPLPRLRQLVLAARDLRATCRQVEERLGLTEPHADPGVAQFGLVNAVYAVGDTFLEVVSPTTDTASAARWLARRGSDSGYMAMVQVRDLAPARARLAGLGVRTVFEVELPDIGDLHLHPKDVPGAILALTAARPEESWRWAGPAWTPAGDRFSAPASAGGVRGVTVAVPDPEAAAARWAEVVDAAPPGPDAVLRLDAERQEVAFVPALDPASEGIVAATLALPGLATPTDVEIAGVRFALTPVPDHPDQEAQA